jgi:hypothetical protein
VLSTLLAAALAAPGAPAPEQPVRLTSTQLLELAGRAEKAGNLRLAKRAYSALARDRDANIRAEALFRQGRMLAGEGRLSQAAELYRRVLDERPGATVARLELAHLLHRMGDSEQALRQLRAVQASRLPASIARMVDRYAETLRAARPLGASIEIAIAPDSNISRSTRSDRLSTIIGDFDISPDSKARSGLGLAIRGQAYRRFALGDSGHSLAGRIAASADLYRQTRFSDVAVDISAGPELQLGRSRVTLELGANQRWFGLKPFTRSVRLGGSWTRPVGDRTQLRLSGSAGLIDNVVNDLQDGRFGSAQVAVEHALSPTTGVGLSMGLDRQAARDPGYSLTNRRLGVFGWRDMGRATVTAGAEFGRLQADKRLLLFPEPRRDRLTRFTLGATLRQLSFGGFAPVTRLVIERNRSTIGFYDYRRTRTEFGIVRAF